MPSHEGKLSEESRKYLKSIILYVKFPFDKAKIRRELEDHISDKIEDLRGRGIDAEEAEKRAVKEMGDAEVIGKALNKEHNPVIGWIWQITNIASVLCIFLSLLFFVPLLLAPVFEKNTIDYISESDIVYHFKINKNAFIDDTELIFTDVYYQKNGTLNIIYKRNDKHFVGQEWSFNAVGKAEDNLGKSYYISGGAISTGFQNKYIEYIQNFNSDAKTVILSYNSFNRNYSVEIPLKEDFKQ